MAVADPRGVPLARTPPHGPKFSSFHAVLGKICMLAPPLGGLASLLRGILNQPLHVYVNTHAPSRIFAYVDLQLVFILLFVGGEHFSYEQIAISTLWDFCGNYVVKPRNMKSIPPSLVITALGRQRDYGFFRKNIRLTRPGMGRSCIRYCSSCFSHI